MFTVVGAVVYTTVNAGIVASNDRALVAATRVDSGHDAPAGTWVTIVDGHSRGRITTPAGLPSGLLDLDALHQVAVDGADQRSQRTVDGHTYELLTTAKTDDPHRDRVVQVALDQHESSEELARLRIALLTGGAIAGALAFLVSYWVARRAIRPLADALTLQRRFVADASHELRTPLALLSTRAQLLMRRSRAGALPADVAASVDEMVTDTRALNEILDDLLIAADPRSDTVQTEVDLSAVADQALGQLQAYATARSVSLTRAGATEPVTVTGSAAALLRLVIALSTNALDHADATVTISVTRSASSAVLSVIDDGPGFTPESAATAFDRFVTHRSTEDGSRHYGIGLAIVAEIVLRHHGTVKINQRQPGGNVTCVLPLSRTTTPSDPPRA